MSHQDHGRLVEVDSHGLKQALDWLLSPRIFGGLTFREDCSWTPTSLVSTVLLWAWSQEAALTERFFFARETIAHTRCWQPQVAVTYQAFIKMLRRHTPLLLFALLAALQRRMRQSLGCYYRVAGYVVFGVDGTRIDVPRTRQNEEVLGATYRATGRKRPRGRRRRAAQKKVATPRVWLTTLWHVGTGLPWCWQHGPSNSSERDHLLEMLPWLPEHSLLMADAGFTGYEFWRTLLEGGHHFLIRVGSNVKLLKQLGYYRECNQRVYLWPDRAVAKNHKPLVLRLIVAQGEKHPVYLVTSLLCGKELSDRQLIQLYQARWGIEVFYRSFKRTFARHKLQSACPQNVLLELDWSLLGLWAVCLYAKWAQHQRGEDIRRTSIASVLRVVRRSMRNVSSRIAPDFLLDQLLSQALIDTYHRQNKASRDYPRKKTDTPGTSPPIITEATDVQIRVAREIKQGKG